MGIAALGVVDLQPHVLQLVAELADLYLGGILFENDDHGICLLYLLKTAGETGSFAVVCLPELQETEVCDAMISLHGTEVKSDFKIFGKSGKME